MIIIITNISTPMSIMNRLMSESMRRSMIPMIMMTLIPVILEVQWTVLFRLEILPNDQSQAEWAADMFGAFHKNKVHCNFYARRKSSFWHRIKIWRIRLSSCFRIIRNVKSIFPKLEFRISKLHYFRSRICS